MPSHLKVRDFLIRQADWPKDNQLLSNLRRLVFIVEQQVPQEEEWDGQDETAQHWLATDHQDHGIGTARLLPSGQIGRMAVLAEHRGSGVGAALLEAAVNYARQLGFSSVFLSMPRATPWASTRPLASARMARSLWKPAFPTTA
jgi:GNAT superfamily N-acetyltransferase